uniref:Uncharacterized protein n=1 Tax=Arundo donax TaxID=35708 RepID=A0A0A9H3W2_ARUDO
MIGFSSTFERLKLEFKG